MNEKRARARARALRAARVVTIAGAILGIGCTTSHGGEPDGMVMLDGDLPDDRLMLDGDLPDFDVPDDRVADASVPDADAETCPPLPDCSCVTTTRDCCTMTQGPFSGFTPSAEDENVGQCCGGACVGPIAPPELLV